MVRIPAVAGQFYPSEKKELEKEIEKMFEKAKVTNKKAIAAISPHAGYYYSGGVAAYSYSALKNIKPETIAIIGPNHTGFGFGVSIGKKEEWETPLGVVKVDTKKAYDIAKENFVIDSSAHAYEHSIEVQIPFLQKTFKEFKILPICVMDQRKETMIKLGNTLNKVLGKKDIIVASTDFSHYVPYSEAYKNDLKAIKKIEELDINGLYEAIRKNNISMCGYGCVAAAIQFAKKRGAKKAELLKYATSGDVTGDKAQVVGYASIIIE